MKGFPEFIITSINEVELEILYIIKEEEKDIEFTNVINELIDFKNDY